MNKGLMKKVAPIALLVAGVLVLGYSLMNKKKVENAVSSPTDLVKNLTTTLPKEGQNKIFVNPDKQTNDGKSYLSTVFMTEEADKVPDYVSDYVFKSFQNIYDNDLENITAVTIAILVKSKKQQFRIIVGKNIADKQSSDFWKKSDKTELFRWLTSVCPKSDPRKLMDFCDISDTLKVN